MKRGGKERYKEEGKIEKTEKGVEKRENRHEGWRDRL